MIDPINLGVATDMEANITYTKNRHVHVSTANHVERLNGICKYTFKSVDPPHLAPSSARLTEHSCTGKQCRRLLTSVDNVATHGDRESIIL